ncbi:MAG TPA: FxSxx-COOH system tetratricopeptide repeat protein [Pyrinomonadaceae bacterium]|nr:FxSxx-COOH system tetratricopeptide repeat protein [Pyrinomonadaceae bacterium]
METTRTEPPKVFISYSHDSTEHTDRVLSLADRLRAEGIDCELDQYVPSPPEGWPRWTAERVESADYVLIICTETYQKRFKGTEEAGKGLGAQWEGAIITQELYDDAGSNAKFIPVLFSTEDSQHIPRELRGVQSYDLNSEQGYEELYRRLTNQPRVTKPVLGSLKPLPTRERKQFFLVSNWNIPYQPNPFFTGREDKLAELRAALDTKGAAAVSGMPGVGKTQTAVEYAHRHRTEYKLILWARAETRETLISDFVNIAGTLQLPEVNAPEQNLAVGAVKRWFDANPDWLLILDNADDLSLAREFIPAAGKGHVILTTREHATGAIATPVNVEKMEESEGAFFLLRRANPRAKYATLEDANEEDREQAKAISREVDGLPLALDQAGAFIEETASSPAEYLELYQTQGAQLRAQRGKLATDHLESVEITFSLSFQKVETASPTAADLLRACAFLAPDAIPQEIFTEGGAHLGDFLATTVNNLLALLNAVGETLRYSLLSRDPEARTLSIHRVVQDVLKDRMDDAAQRQWAERIVKAVNQVLPEFDETDSSEWHRFERLLPHARVCAGLIERWDLKLPEAAQLLTNAARYMHDHAVLMETEPLYVTALAIRKDLYGQDALETAVSLHNLGWLKHDQGKYKEAEPLLLQALEIRKLNLGEHDIAVAQSLQELGSLKLDQGKYAEAKAYYNKSVESLDEVLDSKDRVLAESLRGLGSVLIVQGKYTESEAALTESFEIKEKLYGTEHVELAVVLGLLGQTYTFLGQLIKAETLLLRARKIVENTFGTVQPSLATILNSLADIYEKQHKLSEAEALSLQALTIMDKVYGQEHPETSTQLNNVALFYEKRGNFIKAEELYLRALVIGEKTLGEDHPKLAVNLQNLAKLYSDCHRYPEADSLFRKAIKIQKKTLPPEHDSLLCAQGYYAELLLRMNRKGEGQKLMDYVRKMQGNKGRKKPKR